MVCELEARFLHNGHEGETDVKKRGSGDATKPGTIEILILNINII